MNFKRILGAFLALTMTVPLFMTGCQKEADDIDSETSIRQAIELNMFVIAEEETDPEQAIAVEKYLNEVLLPEYRTAVKVNYVTADKYWEEVDKAEAEAIAYQEQVKAEEEAAKEAAKLANTGKNKNEVDEEAEELDEEEMEAIAESKYDKINKKVFETPANEPFYLDNPYQLDIFVVDSAEKYKELIDAERLAPLTTYISLENKILNSYVFPTFMTAAKLGGNDIYGLPVNKPIGQYEYLVFNKELLDKYNYNSQDLKTFDALASYLAVIAANEPGVVPLTHAPAPQFFEYYGEEGNAVGLTSNQIMASAFSERLNEVVKNHFATIRAYKAAGYIPDTYTEGTKFAVDVRKGYAYSPAQWSKDEGTEYVCEIYKRPVASNDNVLDSIFVVSAASQNAQRAAEIIRYFNTDPVIANILQYGIEGTHYFLNNETGKIKINPESGYVMNSKFTGNEYIKYVLEGEENHTEDYKQQNIDSIASMYLGYVPEISLEDELVLEEANAIAQQYYPGLLAGAYDVEAVFAEINAKLANIDVTSKIEAILAENPALAEEREIYADGDKPEEPAEEVTAEAEATEETEGETAQEPVEEREPQVAGNTKFDKMVANLDGDFYKFGTTGSAAPLAALHKKAAPYYDIEKGGNVVIEEEVNDLKKLNTEEDEELIGEEVVEEVAEETAEAVEGENAEAETTEETAE